MEIIKKNEAATLIIEIKGRIDTLTSPIFEAELKKSINGTTELILDFAAVEYISSAGLRVILQAQKVMNNQGTMIVKNVPEIVMEVFEITGFSEILNIEA